MHAQYKLMVIVFVFLWDFSVFFSFFGSKNYDGMDSDSGLILKKSACFDPLIPSPYNNVTINVKKLTWKKI